MEAATSIHGSSVTIEIEDSRPNWLISMKERLQIFKRGKLKDSSITSFSCSIYRVPYWLRQHNEKAYDPQIISIGPFYYEKRKTQLLDMEEYKWRYLDDILSRNGEGSLERYFDAVKQLEERARKCYSEVIKLDSNSFVEMMVLDACFIIEFLQKLNSEESNDDPIIHLDWLQNAVLTDLFLVENQIPYFILQQLSDLIGVSDPDFLPRTVGCIFSKLDSTTVEKLKNSKIQHLLHLIHTIFVLSIKEKSSETSDFQRIPCASKLKEVGIRFKERADKYDAYEVLDIEFEKGVIEIPSIKLSDKANIMFLNFIAFEQCYCTCKKYFTAYTAFMSCLISNVKDVEVLCRVGILCNWLGSDGDVAALFNNMVRDLIIREEDFYLSRVCNEINRHCDRPWPKLRTTLVHDYFRNPWAILSFCAALLLLLLTMTQTFFSSFPKFAYGH